MINVRVTFNFRQTDDGEFRVRMHLNEGAYWMASSDTRQWSDRREHAYVIRSRREAERVVAVLQREMIALDARRGYQEARQFAIVPFNGAQR
jgi:hypothetical protein